MGLRPTNMDESAPTCHSERSPHRLVQGAARNLLFRQLQKADSPFDSAHGSTLLTVPERSRREGRELVERSSVAAATSSE